VFDDVYVFMQQCTVGGMYRLHCGK